MWLILFWIAVATLVAVHLFWRRRLRRAELDILGLKSEADRARAEEANARAEIRSRDEALLDSINDGILFLDANSRVTETNRALTKMFPLNGSAKGKTVLEVFRLHPLDDLVREIQTACEPREVEIELPGNQQRFFEVSGSIIERPGGAGVILTFHEITRLKQLESMRKEFVANVSHELRTPLSLIKGYSETLLAGAMDDRAAAEKFLGTIHRNAERLALIIEDLLTISSLESGQAALERQSLRLQPLVQRVINDLQARSSKRSMRVENLVPAGALVCADLQRLQQVLTNLIDNAIKYGRENGRVSICAQTLPDASVQISVADDGPGIPVEALERIFERFYRVDKGRSREQGGTGLGLSIVKHIVQSHGGVVWAESELEKGSTFHFTLPADRDADEFVQE